MKFSVTSILISFLIFAPLGKISINVSAQTWEWGRHADTAVHSYGQAVTTDKWGNVWSAGWNYSAGAPITFGGITIPGSPGAGQAIWVKYTNSGTVLWADGAICGGFPGGSYVYDITTDLAGNLIIFGEFSSGTLQIGSVTLINAFSGLTNQYFVAKISPAGTVLWAVADGNGVTGFLTFSAVNITSTGSVTTDAAGNIYITSAFSESETFINGVRYVNSTVVGGAFDIFVAKYTPLGTVAWANTIGGDADDLSFGIAVTPAGNVYITGAFRSSSIAVGLSTITNATASFAIPWHYAFIAKFSAATGAPLWAESAGGTTSIWGSFGINLVSDNAGNVYMTGNFSEPSITLGGTTITRTYAGTTQPAMFLVKYSPSDLVIWAKTIESNVLPGGYPTWFSVTGYSLALSPCGQVWVSGNYYTPINIDGHILDTTQDKKPRANPVYLVGYDASSGDVMNYTALNSYGSLQQNIACDFDGNIFISGSYQDSLYVGPDSLKSDTLIPNYYTAKYIAVLGSNDTSYMRTDTSFCSNSGITLSAPYGYSLYYWDDSTTSRTRTVTKAGIYYVLSVRCADSVLIDSFNVKYIPVDTSFNHIDTDFCSLPGDSLTIKGPSGFKEYIWSNGSKDSLIVVDTSGQWYVMAYNGCSLTIDTFNILFLKKPVVKLGNDTIFCAGDTLLLTSHQADSSSYAWSTGASDSTIRVHASGTYSLTVTYTNGCSGNDAITVTVSPLPVVDIGADTALCNNIPPTLKSSVVYSSSAIYEWSTGATTSSIVAADTGTYWLKVTIAGCSMTDTMKLKNIYDSLSLPNQDTAICLGGIVKVRAAGTPGMKYQWLPTAGISWSTVVDPIIKPDTSDMYYLVASISGCPDIIDSFYIDVQPYPMVSLGQIRTVCSDDTLRLQPKISPAWYKEYSYLWSPGKWLDDSITSTVIFTPGNSAKLTLVVSSSAGCKGEDSLLVQVYPGNFIKLDTQIRLCPHDSIILLPGAPLSGVTYRWHPSIYLDDSIKSDPVVRPLTSQTYWAVATNIYGCRDTVTADVQVDAGAQIYLGDSVTIFSGELYHIPTKTNCLTFAWFPTAGLSSSMIADPVASPQLSTKYVVKGTTEWGCSASDSINIYVSEQSLIDLPNAFVPGSANGKFKLIKRGEVQLNYFRIYNRWGNMIFQTTDIEEGWDGTYKGIPQPSGVYIYHLDMSSTSGKVFNKKGNVTMIK